MSAPPRLAAAVVVVRDAAAGCEVLLVRRRGGASFMANSFVFPGGAADPGEDDLRVTAARELLEEAAVRVDPSALIRFAHWITPNVEAKRFSAQFFAAAMPPDQEPRVDGSETVELTWVRPADAPRRGVELRLPPPQVLTLHELAGAQSVAEVLAWAAQRGRDVPTILPRLLPGAAPALLLPWDPEYETAGVGESISMPGDHPITRCPSRIVRDRETWRLLRQDDDAAV